MFKNSWYATAVSVIVTCDLTFPARVRYFSQGVPAGLDDYQRLLGRSSSKRPEVADELVVPGLLTATVSTRSVSQTVIIPYFVKLVFTGKWASGSMRG